MTPTQRLRHEARLYAKGARMNRSSWCVATALTLGWLLRFVGYWLAEWGHRIDAWAGVEPIKAGGSD